MANPKWTRDTLAEYVESGQVEVGIFTNGTPTIIGRGQITIGKYTLMGPNVEILPFGDHRWEWTATYPFNEIECFKWTMEARPHNLPSSKRFNISIGSDVWLGYKSTILHGAEIGDGAVVGARAVVAGKVEPYSVVVGNPAKEIHKRFDQKTIDVLMKVKWWDWPVKVIVVNLDVLTSPPDTEKLEYIWRRLEGKGKNQNQ